MTDAPGDRLAARRFAIINAVRIGGVVALLAGVAILSEALAFPQMVGAALVAAGAAGTFLAPLLLARRWSTRHRR